MFIFDISFNRHTNKYNYKLSHQLAVLEKLGHVSPLIVWFKPYFQAHRVGYSAHLFRRSNAYLFRKSTCTRSTLTKLPVSKLQREQHINFNLHVYFDVIASQAQATPSAMATYNYSFQMYLPRAAFLKRMVFSVGIRRFKVRGVVYSYQTILTGCYGAVNLDINYPSYL